MYISPELESKLKQKAVLLNAAAAQGKQISATTWQYYVDSEDQLIDLMNDNPPSEEAPGNIEVSWVLYFFNNEAGWVVRDALRLLGMPTSQITAADWAKWEIIWQGQGVLFGDGSLVSEAKYAMMDAGWSEAFLNYLLLDAGELSIYEPFGNTPAQLTIMTLNRESVTVALFSDWAAGTYPDGNLTDSPAVLISQQIAKLAPNVSIHLGDTYYSGTGAEEQANLLDYWPAGSQGNFTLNANHEMYDGANGLFTTTLRDPLFRGQRGTTYFSVTIGNWVVVGLDTAYYDTSTLYMKGALVDDNQINFLQQIGQHLQQTGQPGALGKQLILLTHHNPLYTDASQTTPLYNQVLQALGGFTTPQQSYAIQPAYWYWGHVHNGIVYESNSNLTGNIMCRCIGHGAIPIGNASWLENNDKVSFYTNTSLADPSQPQQNLRVMNGFITLTFDVGNGTLTETFYNQDGSVAWTSAA